MSSWKTLESLAFHPLVVVGSIALGVVLGLTAPEHAEILGAFSDLYVRLLKMLVIPLVMSAIIYNLRRLVQRSGSGQIARRTVVAFVVAMLAAASIGTLSALVLHPGATLDAETQAAMGRLIQADSRHGGINEALSLAEKPREAEKPVLERLVRQLVPENVFAALIAGDNLKVVIFSLIFGIAAALVGGDAAERFNSVAHSIFAATLALTRYFGILLPPASLALAAHQTATVGIEPLRAMPAFLLTLAMATALALSLCVALVWLFRRDWRVTLSGFQEPFFMAMATRNSIACLPQMIDALVRRLRFDSVLVEVIAPLGTSLVRLGPAMFYAVATLFIAEIYGRPLGVAELALVVGSAALAGFASAGMTGVVVIYQTGLVCNLLDLPFEAALVLFLVVEPVSDTLRTLVVVFGNMAISAVVCRQTGEARGALGEAAR